MKKLITLLITVFFLSFNFTGCFFRNESLDYINTIEIKEVEGTVVDKECCSLFYTFLTFFNGGITSPPYKYKINVDGSDYYIYQSDCCKLDDKIGEKVKFNRIVEKLPNNDTKIKISYKK